MISKKNKSPRNHNPTASWAAREYRKWRQAVKKRKKTDAIYNEWLTQVDTLHHQPTLDWDAPILRKLQSDLNRIYDLRDALYSDSPKRFSFHRLVNKVLRWALRPYLSRQHDILSLMVHILNEMIDFLDTSTRRLHDYTETQIRYFQQFTPWLDRRLEEVQNQQNHNVTYNFGFVIHELQKNLLELELQTHEEIRADLQSLVQAIEQFERRYYPHIRPEPYRIEPKGIIPESMVTPPGFNADSDTYRDTLPSPLQPISQDFRYIVFEEIFRGSSAWLEKKFRDYIPIFEASPEPILDLGCGRGEFLKLMGELGKEAYGLEINSVEVQRLKAQGFRVIQEDILEHLEHLHPAAVGGVFCSQVIEHLPPDKVFRLLERLYVVMKPNAPFIFETVNPLSVYGFHHLYHIDPTHIFPVHPQTLVFFLRYIGFKGVEVRYISPLTDDVKLPAVPENIKSTPYGSYLDNVVKRLNTLLFSPLEYFVRGERP